MLPINPFDQFNIILRTLDINFLCGRFENDEVVCGCIWELVLVYEAFLAWSSYGFVRKN